MTKSDNIWVDTVDVDVPGVNGQYFTSNQATIWRWREAYQHDFAGRMKWTGSAEYQSVNHNPILVVNGTRDPNTPLYYDVEPGENLIVDASQSFDPDGDSVTYKWWQYLDASAPQRDMQSMPKVQITVLREDSKTASLSVPGDEVLHTSQYSEWVLGTGTPTLPLLHVILEAWDDGAPKMVSYRRIVLRVKYLDMRKATQRRKLPGEL
jgi:hypothetical protein